MLSEEKERKAKRDEAGSMTVYFKKTGDISRVEAEGLKQVPREEIEKLFSHAKRTFCRPYFFTTTLAEVNPCYLVVSVPFWPWAFLVEVPCPDNQGNVPR